VRPPGAARELFDLTEHDRGRPDQQQQQDARNEEFVEPQHRLTAHDFGEQDHHAGQQVEGARHIQRADAPSAGLKAPEREGDESQRGRDQGELHAQVGKVRAELEKELLGKDIGGCQLLILAARDGVLEAFPRARVTPVHGRVAQIRDNRHVDVERHAQLGEKRGERHVAAVRQGQPRQSNDDEIPERAPPEPPRCRMRQPVHAALAQQHKHRELHRRHGNRVKEAARNGRAQQEEHRQRTHQRDRRQRPIERLPHIPLRHHGAFDGGKPEKEDQQHRARRDQPGQHRPVVEPVAIRIRAADAERKHQHD